MGTRPPVDDGTMPLLIEPHGDLEGSAVALGFWVAGHRHDLDEWLHRVGAVLMRGFGIGSAGEFHDVVAAVRPQLLNYAGGDSPREALGDRIYTSTEFPPNKEIGLHNELSYTRTWPERVFFCCLVAARSGGETHIADSRNVFAQMDRAVRDRFSEEGVIYRHRAAGQSWLSCDVRSPQSTQESRNEVGSTPRASSNFIGVARKNRRVRALKGDGCSVCCRKPWAWA